MDVKHDETGAAIVPVLACVLGQLCTRNDRLMLNNRAISKFHALRPPNISIREYLSRIAKYALCSGECFVLSLVYVDRIIQGNPNFIVNSLNIHRLLITSVMLAAKFFDDQYFNNAYYAKVGGVPCTEMNSLEVEFLFMTNFTLFVSTETYKQYYEELWNHANSNSTCGCNRAKVPPLILPFEEEEKKRKMQLQKMIQLQQQSESGVLLGDGEEDEASKVPLTLPPVQPMSTSSSTTSTTSASSRRVETSMSTDDRASETPIADIAEADGDVEETPGGDEQDTAVEIEEDGDIDQDEIDEDESETTETKRPTLQTSTSRDKPDKKTTTTSTLSASSSSFLPPSGPPLTHSLSWGKLAQAQKQQQLQLQHQHQQQQHQHQHHHHHGGGGPHVSRHGGGGQPSMHHSHSTPSMMMVDSAMSDSPVQRPIPTPTFVRQESAPTGSSSTQPPPSSSSASQQPQQPLFRQPLTYRAVTYPQPTPSNPKPQPQPSQPPPTASTLVQPVAKRSSSGSRVPSSHSSSSSHRGSGGGGGHRTVDPVIPSSSSRYVPTSSSKHGGGGGGGGGGGYMGGGMGGYFYPTSHHHHGGVHHHHQQHSRLPLYSQPSQPIPLSTNHRQGHGGSSGMIAAQDHGGYDDDEDDSSMSIISDSPSIGVT